MDNWGRHNSGWLDDANYVRNTNPPKYYIELLPRRVNQLKRQYGEDWCVVICGDPFIENDYYAIPFIHFRRFLVERYMTPKGKDNPKPVRWQFQVRDGLLVFFPPKDLEGEVGDRSVDVRGYYANHRALSRHRSEKRSEA